ncbi:hypothetical protein GOBAR_DD24304 [Gossypium barbadense]|nr:hypothetical protein GOBAR_DD24304 [Gossypium barbadense]
MAEGKQEKNTTSEESVKLFVGQVPKHMTEAQVLAIFEEFALVDEVNIINDKATLSSRGCCFVICPSREEADKAVDACHNKKTLPGASSPLQVKYADGELERLEHKLFVGMLPKNVKEDEVADLFSKYGTIKDLQIIRGSQQTSKGCAFLKYETKEQALDALQAVNGKHRMEAPGSYGLMQYRMPPMQNQSAFHSMIPPVNQASALRGITPDLAPRAGPRNYAMPPGSYVGSAYPAVQGVQYPMAYPGGIISHHPLTSSPSSLPQANTSSNSSSASSVGTSSGSQIEGPPGANLFIYHIPQEFGDQELTNAFQGYGRVLSAKVFVDKATGASKCFGVLSLKNPVFAGFVSYDSPAAAQNAINMMNGCQLGGKKLKVQLKRDNKQNKPY